MFRSLTQILWLAGLLSTVSSCAQEPTDSPRGDARGQPQSNGSYCLANTGSASPSPIYAIKQRLLPNGSTVELSDLIVTATTADGFFVQVDPSSPQCDPTLGSRYAAGYVYVGSAGTPLPTRGDALQLNATLNDWHGQIQLNPTSYTSGGAATAAIPATDASIETVMANDSASALEGVLIELTDITVTDTAPVAGPGDDGLHEIELQGGLRIDDFAGHALQPAPQVGQTLAQLRGVVAWRNQHLKVGPRDAADLGPCVPECNGRVCGPDPLCGDSCGSCASGICDGSGQCRDDTCTPDCSGRQCGPDPVCGNSCGACSNGESCTMDGTCESQAPDAPAILVFSSNLSIMTSSDTLTISAVVTDPDGIDDLIGGVLEDPTTSASYGAFSTNASEGAYSISLSWNAINSLRPIDTDPGGGSRAFVGRFFDTAGHNATASLTVSLQCASDGSLAVCDGACRDLRDDAQNCGGCGDACVAGPDPVCSAGQCDPCPASQPTPCGDSCVDLMTSPFHCGSCYNNLGGFTSCVNGAPACPYPDWPDVCGTACTDMQVDVENCGNCGHDCATFAVSMGSTETAPTCAGGSCGIRIESTDRQSCDALCAGLGMQCGGPDRTCPGFWSGTSGENWYQKTDGTVCSGRMLCDEVPVLNASCGSAGYGAFTHQECCCFE